jgi:hypothetical protein
MTYEEMEARAFQDSSIVSSQGGRINKRLQVAFNYAIEKEEKFGKNIHLDEVCDGVSNGIINIMANICRNFGSKEIATFIIATLVQAHENEEFEKVYKSQTSSSVVKFTPLQKGRP